MSIIKALHIDDDENQLFFSQTMLQNIDNLIQVEITTDPHKVIEDAKKHDVIVTDYQMPVINGIDLAQKIRENDDVPIIIYTSQGSEEVAEKAFKVGINDYIRKEMEPDHYRVLAKRIETVVERHRAEQAVKESETRLRNTLDNMLEGCQIIDKEYRYIYLNEAALEHARKRSEKLIGRTMMECYPGIDETEMYSNLKKCMTERVHINMENRFTYPNGDEAWFQLSFEPVPEGVFILSIDITERVMAEHDLRVKEETLRNTFKASPHAILVSDLNGIFLDCNDAAIHLFGCSCVEDLIGSTYYELVSPRDLERSYEITEYTIKAGLFQNIEFQLVAADGREFPALVSASLVHGDDGVPLGFVATVQDISEKKFLEEQVKEHIIRLSEITEQQALGRVEDELIGVDQTPNIFVENS